MHRPEHYRFYKVFFGCDCFAFDFKYKKDIYNFCKTFKVFPSKVLGYYNVTGTPSYELEIEKRANGKGWKLV